MAEGGRALIEQVDRWILPLDGRVVVEVLLEYTVLLRFDDGSVVVIEAPFVLRKNGQEHLIDPEGDVIELIRLRPFADAVVAEATALKTGALRLDLIGGTVVEVSVLDGYESWTFSGRNNLLVVATPGGELAIWPASVGVTHDELSRAYRTFMTRLTELLNDRGLDEVREAVDLSADEYDLLVAHLGSSLWRAADRESARVATLRLFPSASGKVAALVGAERVRRASPDFVRAATGQVIGGVAPVGHPAPIRTLVDRALAQYDEVWAAGGVARAVFPSTFTELVAVTGGEPADVA